MRQDISGWTLRRHDADIGRNRGPGIRRGRIIAQDARHPAQAEAVRTSS